MYELGAMIEYVPVIAGHLSMLSAHSRNGFAKDRRLSRVALFLRIDEYSLILSGQLCNREGE